MKRKKTVVMMVIQYPVLACRILSSCQLLHGTYQAHGTDYPSLTVLHQVGLSGRLFVIFFFCSYPSAVSTLITAPESGVQVWSLHEYAAWKIN